MQARHTANWLDKAVPIRYNLGFHTVKATAMCQYSSLRFSCFQRYSIPVSFCRHETCLHKYMHTHTHSKNFYWPFFLSVNIAIKRYVPTLICSTL